VGQGKSHTLLEVIDFIEEMVGTKLRLLHTEARSGDVRYTQADISEAQRCLGYDPQVSFEDGLAETLRYFGRQIAWTFNARV
jgi:UDP-glucose 4-epimerase